MPTWSSRIWSNATDWSYVTSFITHNFGYFLETSPNSFYPIIFGASASDLVAVNPFTDKLYFGLNDTTSGKFWSSNEKNNGPNDYDHMVTYLILDKIAFHYAIAFEDLDLGDKDYNDLVVDVQFVRPVTTIPEPAGMLLLGTGFIGFAVVGRKTFKK